MRCPNRYSVLSHFQNQHAAVRDGRMREPRLVEGLAVQPRGLDVLVAHRDVVCQNREKLPIAEPNCALCEEWTSDLIDRRAWAHGVESQRAEDVPRRSLSAIIVTGYTRRAVSVPQVHDLS